MEAQENNSNKSRLLPINLFHAVQSELLWVLSNEQ
jgi:hypothetical protein